MRQSDADAKKDGAADDCAEKFVAESRHVALHQSYDWRLGEQPIVGCAAAHVTGVSSIEPQSNSRSEAMRLI